ncbi:MAG: hypothetical protein KH704_10410 [Clostridiales bacterium]|nr:hypothetical protein [Clostridiales bacterium]
MKKQLVSILTAGCLMAAMVPAAFAADTNDLQAQINAAQAGSTITLSENTTITEPLVIDKAITLDGASYSLSGTMENGLICIDTDDLVTIQDLTVNGSSIGIDLISDAPEVKIENSTINVPSRGIRFWDNGENTGVFTGANLTLDNTTVQNTLKPTDKTYENWSHQGDSRGISIWNVKNSTINIVNGSEILGFGYPINMAGDMVNGVRDMEDSTINITDSDIWGWCALNIWTIDTTFNIKNSNLKGFVETDNAWNSFATVVLNEDIYKGVTDSSKANVFNISGGSVSSTCVSNVEEVYHCLFRLDKEFMSEFNFAQANRKKVALTCTDPFSAFLATYEGMEIPDFETWAKTKLTGAAENTTYYWEAIAPGVNAPKPAGLFIQSADTVTLLDGGMGHEGGFNQ